ncbi:12227_t:CDS:2 [Racocetra fulgida]|uniref:12227_t:CDS:1 n=1 Tax=Racocetra fulgida TaxID=60492 RepID=A0A9N9F722_9GLOM|nr:12227_t:CDS:2 [Racocetra fulgida]
MQHSEIKSKNNLLKILFKVNNILFSIIKINNLINAYISLRLLEKFENRSLELLKT